jgi:hypothetical protein
VSDEQINQQIKVEYRFDQYLMHLIQEVTKRPPIEILAFFYELSEQVADIGSKTAMKDGNRRIRKKIVEYFPGTSIPFRILVTGSRRTVYQKGAHGNYSTHDGSFECWAEVGFPENRTYIKEKDLRVITDALMEKALLDAPLDNVVLPEFAKPVIKTPKMYKPLMDAFLGRKSEPKKSRKKKADGTTPQTI